MAHAHVRYKLFDPACRPTQGYPGDACWDFYAAERVYIDVGDVARVRLGIAVELEEGWELQVRPRSSQSAAAFIVALGTVDAGYRGEVAATIINLGVDAYVISHGAKACQVAIRQVPSVSWHEVEELGPSVRGARGWGSTGSGPAPSK